MMKTKLPWDAQKSANFLLQSQWTSQKRNIDFLKREDSSLLQICSNVAGKLLITSLLYGACGMNIVSDILSINRSIDESINLLVS